MPPMNAHIAAPNRSPLSVVEASLECDAPTIEESIRTVREDAPLVEVVRAPAPASPTSMPLAPTLPSPALPVAGAPLPAPASSPLEDALGLASPLARRIAPGSVGAHHWNLDPNLTFLNHGSYGSTPRAALRAQSEYRERMERDPVRFFKVDLEHLMDGVREKLGAFINCPPADLAPICNATWALCTILKATRLEAGDEVLVTDHEYGSLMNELERVAARAGAVVVKVAIPFPIRSSQDVVERYVAAITPRTKLAFIAHITSASSMIYPVAPILRELNARGVDSVLDGAHSPGQIPVDIRALAPTYFVGSGHKWLSGPKGSGFMYVRPDRQHVFRPLALSSRAAKVRPERALFLRDFDYQGTDDYTPVLALPHSIEALGSLLPGGWPQLLRQNHELAIKGRDILCQALEIEAPTPDAMVGSMATLLIPEPREALRDRPTAYDDALQDVLYEKYRIVVPIWRLGSTNQRVVRISAHLYNSPAEYEYLAHALKTELALEG